MLKAMNLVTTVPASDIALAAPVRDRPDADPRPVARLRADRHEPVAAHRRRLDTRVTSAEVAAFIDDANSAFPALGLTPARVSLVHRGVVPAAGDGTRRSPHRAAR